MAHAVARSPQLEDLIRRLDRAVANADVDVLCQEVKESLIDVVGRREDFINSSLLLPAPDRYARRLLHRDPAGRYSIVVMVWDSGQSTPLHDHAGKWCVECVYRGGIRVTSYNLTESDSAGIHFSRETMVTAGVGEAGTLIPPFEYHILENAGTTPAVTLHVYSGEMTWYNAYLPLSEGVFRRERRELSYTA